MKEFARARRIIQKIKLGADVFEVEIDAHRVVKGLLECRGLFGQSADKQSLRKGAQCAPATADFGKTITDLFELVFGAEIAARILAFYEGNYIEMCAEVLPFIAETVIPKATGAIDAEKRRKARYYRKGSA